MIRGRRRASIRDRIMDLAEPNQRLARLAEPTQRVARLLLIALYPLRVLDHVTRDHRHR